MLTFNPALALIAKPAAAALPPLREDLKLFAVGTNRDGSPAWVIQDPISNAFYRIGWLEFELLARWDLANPEAILASTHAETLLDPSRDELAHLHAFLLQHQLLEQRDPAYKQALITRLREQRTNRVKWLIHNYLFFRLPLLYPAQTLQRLLPWLSWIFSRTTVLIVLLLGVIGLALTARQWDVFTSSFVDTLSPSGIFGYLIALAITKSLHELGHALTATLYGLRVAHMGIAFVVMWPMLYTDTGEAWRLAQSRQRLAIASAGILTELAIAAFATLAWNLTDDGDLKQALFFLATTSWVLSLALNASPFMRFDGYFILSDWLDLPNLHERAFALARVALRNTLFDFGDPDPEYFAPSRRRALIVFAWLTWLYRLIVFIGIAVAVYLLFFKLLGLILFAIELLWFILFPIWRELTVWHQRRAEIRLSRRVFWLVLIAGLMLLAVWPWQTVVHGPGYAHPEQMHAIYSPLPAQLLAAPPELGAVTAGQSLFVLEAPHRSQLIALN
ncbi:putative peptide zinc metalloprotease protein [Allochromatium warmingii]|uniref:Putative peptide zinc metalloprotease protein n=1 Tax=Allochromatium warmingii TaxID=61595 RepID=A0A1H3GKP4_ALLWA|nr:site-2 protease family protein [Allochromatium warmingii]SDY03876.1 putative peptide zinc metalloprotease protein [Allochromatium warmingii]